MYYNNQNKLRSSTEGINIKLPWDSNTAKGFFVATIILILFYFFSPLLHNDDVPKIKEIKTVPIELLNLGSGDGTGRRKGNLTAEGVKGKGENLSINIEDAQKTPTTTNNQKVKNSNNTDVASDFKPVDKLSGDKNNSQIAGNDNKNVGDNKNGDDFGSGLGSKGSGKGLGDGFGDIDWGGGGNRVVLDKKLPKFPNGVKTSGQIILKFKVLPDGTVTSVVPLQKADPELEFAAIQALKKWRFNPLKDDAPIMVGTIPLTFILR